MAPVSNARLWVRPLIIHATAAAVTMSYNIMCRSYYDLPAMNEQKLRLAGVGYFFAVSAATALFTNHLLRTAKSSSDYAMIPIWRAVLSGVCWLGLIPTLALIAIYFNGQVDPVQFPNFCISVIIGWLIATTFTTILYAEEFSLQPGLHWSRQLSYLLNLIKTIPYLGTGIPVISAVLLLVVIQPNDQTSIAAVFNNFLIGLYTAGAYGVFYLSRKAKKVCTKLQKLKIERIKN
jgi:hypothetical protein